MEAFDTIKPQDPVTITIWGPEDTRLYQATNTDLKSIDEAIHRALTNAALVVKPEDCVFEVTNDNTFVSHRYRVNAHGHIVQI
ncbi:MAG: hypothetical protein HDS79_07385 [Bacteroidales bacterium]|nr:hypothetical protein [Bacteroidales bacterium]